MTLSVGRQLEMATLLAWSVGGGVACREAACAISLRSFMSLGTENMLCCRKMRGDLLVLNMAAAAELGASVVGLRIFMRELAVGANSLDVILVACGESRRGRRGGGGGPLSSRPCHGRASRPKMAGR